MLIILWRKFLFLFSKALLLIKAQSGTKAGKNDANLYKYVRIVHDLSIIEPITIVFICVALAVTFVTKQRILITLIHLFFWNQ